MSDALGNTDEDDDWFEHDLDRDILASLELLVFTLDRARTDHLYWKWVILSAHNALQGICAALLTATDGSGALEEKWEKELGRYHDQNTQKAIVDALGGDWVMGELSHPDVKMASLPELLERLPSPHAIKLPKPQQIAKAHSDAQALFRLHEARNNYAHFGELNWIIIEPHFHNVIRVAVRKMNTLIMSVEPKRYRSWDKDRLLLLIADANRELDEIKEKLVPFLGIEH